MAPAPAKYRAQRNRPVLLASVGSGKNLTEETAVPAVTDGIPRGKSRRTAIPRLLGAGKQAGEVFYETKNGAKFALLRLAEKEGFEPSRRLPQPTPLAGEPLQPYLGTSPTEFDSLFTCVSVRVPLSDANYAGFFA